MRYDIENIKRHKMVKIGCTEEEALSYLSIRKETLIDKALSGETIRQWYKVRAIGDMTDQMNEQTNKVFGKVYAEQFTKDWNAMRKLFGKAVEND